MTRTSYSERWLYQEMTLYPQHLRARTSMLRKRIRKNDLDAFLVTNHRDVRYLTGFVGDDSWALVRARTSDLHVLSDFRFEEQIEREAPHVKAVMRKESLPEALAKLARLCRLKRIGLQADGVTIAQRKAIARKVGAKLVPIDDGLREQRAVKDHRELAQIRKAVKVTQDAFARTIQYLRPGQAEWQVAAYLEYQMRLLGADGSSFPPIVAVDANSSLPHAIPGKTKLKRGCLVLLDWGAVVNGYCADLTRVVALGRMKPAIREIYQIVLEAHNAAIAAIVPGKALKDVDAVARDFIEGERFGDRFGHSLGHGVGLEVHELPVLSSRSKGKLKVGHVVTVEPGIYLPGVGGVRIESDVLVTPRGAKVLSDLPTSLESAII